MVHKFHLLLLNVIIKFLIRIMIMTLICFFFQIKNLIHTIPKAFAISFAVLKLRIVFPVYILFILVLDIPTFFPSLCCDKPKSLRYYSILFSIISPLFGYL